MKIKTCKHMSEPFDIKVYYEHSDKTTDAKHAVIQAIVDFYCREDSLNKNLRKGVKLYHVFSPLNLDVTDSFDSCHRAYGLQSLEKKAEEIFGERFNAVPIQRASDSLLSFESQILVASYFPDLKGVDYSKTYEHCVLNFVENEFRVDVKDGK